MKTFFCLALFILGFNLQAQYRYGPIAQLGLSHIWTDYDADLQEQERFLGAAYSLGVFAERSLSEKSNLGFSLNLQQIGSKEKTIGPYYKIPANNRDYQDLRTEHRLLGYLSLPIYYSYNLDKFQLQLAWNTSLLLAYYVRTEYAWRRDNGEAHPAGEDQFYRLSPNNLAYKYLDFGPQVALLYSLSDRLQVQASYYHGLQQIIYEGISSEAYIRSLQFGFRWVINEE
ncbi:outer membrane beta-barrel protein [Croceimicrobium hydrocarbonivorans]|uniref:Outer membrane beta-barrel protein n=1 Tax=Croceimicrobium hydrocarbonivorans TaxID=2761580 RepID=A0A7H0VE32_9FLAO|nr:outer membrane beta-barrel protein [Croceimicrobium hydrocarbonivorans]QNR23980.1 outer membrane beta-barrel protein [Croceimicrobium hydrocarbonivorans]